MRKNNIGPYPKYKQIVYDITEVDQLLSYLDCAIGNCIHPLDVVKFIEKTRKQLKKQNLRSKKELMYEKRSC